MLSIIRITGIDYMNYMECIDFMDRLLIIVLNYMYIVSLI